jgi:fumarylacetoacetate (FAA) hydrolase
MKLISFYPNRETLHDGLVAGVLHGDWAVDLTLAAADAGEAWGEDDLDLGELLQYELVDLELFRDLVDRALARGGPRELDGLPMAWRLEEVDLGPPLPFPTSVRDFYAFEEHVKAARARRGAAMIPEWYEIPVFYFSNHNAIIGPADPVHRPRASRELDFELEVACVIAHAGIDIAAAQAEEHILGYTVMNDWSARDLQRQEMKMNLGPAKGKDFATSLGPWIVTPDELADRRVGEGRYDLAMLARVNGREVSRGNFKDLHFSFAQMIERASADVLLLPGDVLGSGTVGTGCILELGPENVPWLEPGDEVELEIEGLGTLANVVADPDELGVIELDLDFDGDDEPGAPSPNGPSRSGR